MDFFRYLYLSSFHVALATGGCAAVFFVLSGSTLLDHWVSLVQLTVVCWLVYIVDRLLDVVGGDLGTERHEFHYKYQYNLQILCIALCALGAFLLLFQSKEVLIYGGILTIFLLVYLGAVVPRYSKAKEWLMPIIYVGAVVGVPFAAAPGIPLSAWLIAVMFALVVWQNLAAFAYYETDQGRQRKAVTVLGSINLFVFLVFFSSSADFPTRAALVFALISVLYSLIVNQKKRLQNHYRWLLDALLFLPLFVFLF